MLLFRKEKGVQRLVAASDCADVVRSLWGGCELYPAPGIGREAVRFPGPASGALGGRSGLYERSGDPLVKAVDRGDDEALRLLRRCFLEGAVFRVPLD